MSTKRITKSQTRTIAFRVPDDIYKSWKDKADKAGISMSDYIWDQVNSQGKLTPMVKMRLMELYNAFILADYKAMGAAVSDDKEVLKQALEDVYNKNSKVATAFMDLMEEIIGPKFYDPNDDSI